MNFFTRIACVMLATFGFGGQAGGGDAAGQGQEWLPALSRQMGAECRLADPARLSDPALTVLDRNGVPLHFVALCDDQPVFGVEAPPLYIDPLAPGATRDHAFLAVRDGLLVQVAREASGVLALTYAALALPPDQAMSAVAGGLCATAEGAPSTVPQAASAEVTERVIFDGTGMSGWEPFGFESGDFDTDARLTGEGLRVAIPEGRGWAKTGLRYVAEPITLPEAGSGEALAVLAQIDAEISNSLTITLADPELDGEDPWKSHILRFHVHEDDLSGVLETNLRDGGSPSDVRFRWPEDGTALQFNFILRADGQFELRDGSGVLLAHVSLGDGLPQGDMTLLAYSQVRGKHWSADLLLKRLALRSQPIVLPPDPDVVGARDVVLFDGTQIAPLWTPLHYGDEDFLRYARLDDGALRLAWPEGEGPGYGYVGMFSGEPVLWLDQFGEGAEARIEFDLTGSESGDFEVGLQQPTNLAYNTMGSAGWKANWSKQPDGSYLFRQMSHDNSMEVSVEGLQALPERFAIVATPEGIGIEAEGLEVEKLPWPQLHDGSGLRLWAYALTPQQGPTALSLRQIRLRYSPGTAGSEAIAPAPGVAPLDRTVLFDGLLTEAWTPRSQNGAPFEELATQGPDGLVLTRRAPVPGPNRIGLFSTEPLVRLDSRLRRTPYDLTLQIDPTSPDLMGMIFLTDDPNRYYDNPHAQVELERVRSGPHKGQLRLRLYSGHRSYTHVQRYLPAERLAQWDGALTLRLRDGQVSLVLGGEELLGLRTNWIVPDRKLYLLVEPGIYDRRPDDSSITLRRVEGGWRTPPGMTAVERWYLVDEEAFSPGGFVEDIAAEMKELEQ